jgi:hypothetical protein
MKFHLPRLSAALLAGTVTMTALPAVAQYERPLARRLTLVESSSEPKPESKPDDESPVQRTAASKAMPTSRPSRSSKAPPAEVQTAYADDSYLPQSIQQPGARRGTVIQTGESAPAPMRIAPNRVARVVPARSARIVADEETLSAAPMAQGPMGNAPMAGAPMAGAPMGGAPMRSMAPTPMMQNSGPMEMSGDMVGGCGDSCGCGGDACGCGDACGGACGSDWFGGRRRGHWFAGVEGIMARPHFSEATAFRIRQDPALTPNNVLAASDTWVYYNYDYEPNVRGYIGYRLDDCCAELRATYTRLESDASASGTANATGSVAPTYFEIQPGPNGTLFANNEVAGDIFDVEVTRSLCTPATCDPCCCTSCPAWDLSWSAGARLARWDVNSSVTTTTATSGRVDLEQNFIGAGPRVGLEGRRYFNRRAFSVYSTLDMSLLVGQFESSVVRAVPSVGVNPATTESFFHEMTRMSPVAEIELGAKWQPTDQLSVSAGWFFQCWWDLGMGAQQTSNLLGQLGSQYMLDDSNIMSWDGLTVKLEYAF